MAQILHQNLWMIAHPCTWGWHLKLLLLLKISTYTYEIVSAMNTVNHRKVVSTWTGEHAIPPAMMFAVFPLNIWESTRASSSVRAPNLPPPPHTDPILSIWHRTHPTKWQYYLHCRPHWMWAPSLLFFTLSPSNTMPGTQGKFIQMITRSLWSWNRARREAICNK